MLLEQALGVVATALIASAKCSCSSTLRRISASGTPVWRVVALAAQIVGGDRDAGGVHAAAREAARFDEGQEIRAVVAAHAQHDRRLRAFGAPIPVLAVDQAPGLAALGQDDGAGAAVLGRHRGGGRHVSALAMRRASAITSVRALIITTCSKANAGAVGDAAHLFDVMRAERLDLRREFADQAVLRAASKPSLSSVPP